MKCEIHPDLDKILKKLAKWDKVQYEALLKKIEEVTYSVKLEHYKNLKAPLNNYKRVHVYSSFVLLFKVEKEVIVFRYYDHHDRIYNLD